MAPPTYSVGDVKYVRESAALGFLEAVKINSITMMNGIWVYSIQQSPSQPLSPNLYGDRTSLINGSVLYFTADELIDLCTALSLAEDKAQSNLANIQSQKNKLGCQ